MGYLKIFSLNLIMLYFFLYIIEIFLNYKKDKLFLKTRLYYLNLFQKDKTKDKFYLNIGPYKFLDKKNKILPLSGYEDSLIFLCMNENNKPITYLSDEYGFNNHNYHENNDYFLIGDSYVQGMCVDKTHNLNSQFFKHSIKTISMGVSGNGPLLEYATYKEFESRINFQNIILFITIENDYWDLNLEKKNKILLNYFKYENYNQNLISLENQIYKKKILDDFFKNKTKRFLNDFLSVYHFNLKEIGNGIENVFNQRSFKDLKYLEEESLDKLFFEILIKFKKDSEIKNKSFFVVFNSLNPDLIYPISQEEKNMNKILIEGKLKKMQLFLQKNKIKFFDFNEYLLKKFKSKKDLEKIFNRIDGRWDHYTEYGYYELAKQIKINLLKN